MENTTQISKCKTSFLQFEVVRKWEDVKLFITHVEIHYSLGDEQWIYISRGVQHELHVSLLMDLTMYFYFIKVYIIIHNFLFSEKKGTFYVKNMLKLHGTF